MDARSLLILGAGGHGKVVGDIASAHNAFADISFLDDQFPDVINVGPWRVVGALESVWDRLPSETDVFVAIGSAGVRMKWVLALRERGFDTPSLIHPRSSVSALASVAPACVVVAQAAINAGASVGLGCIVNTGATVGHDCTIEDGAHVAPGANLAGGVRVGKRSWIGLGAVVLQGATIGDDVTVGAGTVVLKDLPHGVTAVGNPARIIKAPVAS